MATTRSSEEEETLKHRYLTVSKILLLITMMYIIWIALLLIGSFTLKLAGDWAVLTLEQWVLSAIALLSIVIVIEVLFLLHHMVLQQHQGKPKKTRQPAYLKGKQVHTITLPLGAQGGIFSKTFIAIDDHRVLNLRYQMIPPSDLWGTQR
ncbi:MAG: hypothetical protein JXA00_03275 [Candidatus Thermoplasmatota archaeon]|nr:hypothetical protein [Candidatus Thermoplasmatota archaeon]